MSRSHQNSLSGLPPGPTKEEGNSYWRDNRHASVTQKAFIPYSALANPGKATTGITWQEYSGSYFLTNVVRYHAKNPAITMQASKQASEQASEGASKLAGRHTCHTYRLPVNHWVRKLATRYAKAGREHKASACVIMRPQLGAL